MLSRATLGREVDLLTLVEPQLRLISPDEVRKTNHVLINGVLNDVHVDVLIFVLTFMSIFG